MLNRPEWKKDALVTTHNGDVLELALSDYQNGKVGVGYADGKAFVFYDDDLSRPYTLIELVKVLKGEYKALEEDNELYTLDDDDRYLELAPLTGLGEEAELAGLSEEDLTDVQERLEAVADEYWGVVEYDA